MSTKLKAKRPLTLTINPGIRALGDQLGDMDHRNLSDEVSWLIEREAARRGLNGYGNGNAKRKPGKRNG